MPDIERVDDEEDPLGGLGGLFGQAQQAFAQAQEAATQEVEGSAGGGAVRVLMNGAFEFSRVTLRPDVVDSSDIEMLEDLIVAALNDAAAKVRARQAEIQQQMLGGLGGLGDLGRLLGGS